jgi:hypothetical protein
VISLRSIPRQKVFYGIVKNLKFLGADGESGDIVQITTTQRGLSPRAEQMLKEEIRKNSLVRTSAGKVPERSKGTIVFILKTK